MTLRAIKVHLTEVDTRGVVRSRIGGEEYIRVEEVCAALPITKDALFERLGIWQAAESRRVREMYRQMDKQAKEGTDAAEEARTRPA